jgi:hypothetical protein
MSEIAEEHEDDKENGDVVTQVVPTKDAKCVIITQDTAAAKKLVADANTYGLVVRAAHSVVHVAGARVRIQRLLIVHAPRIIRSSFSGENQPVNTAN